MKEFIQPWGSDVTSAREGEEVSDTGLGLDQLSDREL